MAAPSADLEVLSLLPPYEGKSVLLIGTGISHLIGELAKNAGQLFVVDFSNESTGSTHKNVKFISTNVASASLDIPLESFDLVFAESVLEHLCDDEVQTFVQSMAKWLKPGGHIFFRETCSNDTVDLNQSNSIPNRDPKFYSKGVFEEPESGKIGAQSQERQQNCGCFG